MTSDGLASDLRDVERRRLRALVAADTVVARQLHAADYELITPGGVAMSGDQYLGDIASGAMAYRVFEPASDIAIKDFGDAGVVRYVARIEVTFGDDGSDAGYFWHTDVYRRTDGHWQAVWSHATRIREGTHI